MIVTCPDCDTSFQLDESRIPQKGIRVRCSRCKHAFHLAHPSASQSEAIDAVAAEAAQSASASTPSVTQDLVDPDAASCAPSVREEINNEDDAEWEFNEDIPSTEEGAGAGDDSGALFAGGSPDTNIDFADDEGDSGLDLASDEDGPDADPSAHEDASGLDLAGDAPDAPVEVDTGSTTPPAADAAVEAEADADQAFGSVDDFSSLMDDDDPLDALVAGSGEGPDDTADELRAQAAAQSTSYAEEGQVDDLGDPEKWDFFDGASSSPPPSPPPSTPIGRIALKSAGAADELTDDWQRTPVADPTEQSRVSQLVESAGRIVGWTVVVAGVALGLVSGLWGTAESFVTAERVSPIGPLEAIDMRARWVDTARAGRLLVVTGGLRNPTREAAPLPGPLEVALLDRMGDALSRPSVSAGVVLSERQLRELPGEVLSRVRAQAAIDLQSARVPAGGMVPFQVLIFDAPTSGLRFEARLAATGRLSLPEPARVAEPVATEPASEALESVTKADAAEASPDGEAAPVASEPADAGPVAPGYDHPYGEDTGMGLHDL